MSLVMQHETWMKLTEIRMKPRGKYLTNIDRALKEYHQNKSKPNLEELKKALHHWKMDRGYGAVGEMPAWRLDERNRNKGVEQLDLQVFGYQGAVVPSVLADLAELPFYGIESFVDDYRAKQALQQARHDALAEMFAGKSMSIKKTSTALLLHQIQKKIRRAKEDAGKAASAAAQPGVNAAKAALHPAVQQAEQIVVGLIDKVLGSYPIEVAQEVMQFLNDLVPQFVLEVAHAIIPYLSFGVSTVMALTKSVQAMYDEYKWVKATGHLASFHAGDALSAALSVRRMIERELNQNLRLASIYGADAAVKGSAIICDAASLGIPTVSAVVTPLAGFAKAVAQLTLNIFLLGRDIYEKQRANKILADSKNIRLSASLFDTCPVLGCYFIACANTSDVVNFIVEDIGSPGWQFDVEVMVREHVAPMIEYARGAISDSRLEVPGLVTLKGAGIGATTAGEYGISNPKNRLKKKILLKLGTALPFIDKPALHEKAVNAGLSRVQVPDGRIYGFGARH